MTYLTQGALGRKSTEWNQRNSVCNKFKGCKRVLSFLAPTAKIQELQDQLQRSYETNLDTEVIRCFSRLEKLTCQYPIFMNELITASGPFNIEQG
jgi:hypothetical protein